MAPAIPNPHLDSARHWADLALDPHNADRRDRYLDNAHAEALLAVAHALERIAERLPAPSGPGERPELPPGPYLAQLAHAAESYARHPGRVDLVANLLTVARDYHEHATTKDPEEA